jgi:hypothetical protein
VTCHPLFCWPPDSYARQQIIEKVFAARGLTSNLVTLAQTPTLFHSLLIDVVAIRSM